MAYELPTYKSNVNVRTGETAPMIPAELAEDTGVTIPAGIAKSLGKLAENYYKRKVELKINADRADYNSQVRKLTDRIEQTKTDLLNDGVVDYKEIPTYTKGLLDEFENQLNQNEWGYARVTQTEARNAFTVDRQNIMSAEIKSVELMERDNNYLTIQRALADELARGGYPSLQYNAQIIYSNNEVLQKLYSGIEEYIYNQHNDNIANGIDMPIEAIKWQVDIEELYKTYIEEGGKKEDFEYVEGYLRGLPSAQKQVNLIEDYGRQMENVKGQDGIIDFEELVYNHLDGQLDTLIESNQDINTTLRLMDQYKNAAKVLSADKRIELIQKISLAEEKAIYDFNTKWIQKGNELNKILLDGKWGDLGKTIQLARQDLNPLQQQMYDNLANAIVNKFVQLEAAGVKDEFWGGASPHSDRVKALNIFYRMEGLGQLAIKGVDWRESKISPLEALEKVKELDPDAQVVFSIMFNEAMEHRINNGLPIIDDEKIGTYWGFDQEIYEQVEEGNLIGAAMSPHVFKRRSKLATIKGDNQFLHLINQLKKYEGMAGGLGRTKNVLEDWVDLKAEYHDGKKQLPIPNDKINELIFKHFNIPAQDVIQSTPFHQMIGGANPYYGKSGVILTPEMVEFSMNYDYTKDYETQKEELEDTPIITEGILK